MELTTCGEGPVGKPVREFFILEMSRMPRPAVAQGKRGIQSGRSPGNEIGCCSRLTSACDQRYRKSRYNFGYIKILVEGQACGLIFCSWQRAVSMQILKMAVHEKKARLSC